jgi:hypothetical protein
VSGESRIPLEYYVEGADLYLKHPTLGQWLLAKNSQLDELKAFLPDTLAAPLVGGLRGAEEVGRERLPGGQAVHYRLSLDPAVMLPRFPDLQEDRVEYNLWVYARTLQPARFTATVTRAHPGEAQLKTRFTYELSFAFWRLPALAVPADVKSVAQDVGAAPMPLPEEAPAEGKPVP